MPKYHIEWTDHVARSAYVTAESESAAREAWIEGAWDWEDGEYTETGSQPTFTLVGPWESVVGPLVAEPDDWELAVSEAVAASLGSA